MGSRIGFGAIGEKTSLNVRGLAAIVCRTWLTAAIAIVGVFSFVSCTSGTSDVVDLVHVRYPVDIPTLFRESIGQDLLIEVPASPEDGFHVEYFLRVPASAVKTRPHRILVEPNNSGMVDDRHTPHRDAALGAVRHGFSRGVSDSIGVPLLIPVFDRPETGWHRYTHALDRETMVSGSGPLLRIDLQLLAMIDHARALLAQANIRVNERILINGFSAAGTYRRERSPVPGRGVRS